MTTVLRKKRLFFILTLISVGLLIVGPILILLLPLESYMLLAQVIYFIFALFLVSVTRYYFEFYTFRVDQERLASRLEEPFTPRAIVMSKEWRKRLEQQGYHLIEEYKQFKFYYKIAYLNEKQKETKTLILIALINDKKMGYEDEVLIKCINEIETTIRKKDKYRHRLFLQFKSYDKLNNDNYKAINSTFWVRKKMQHLVVINVAYFISDNLVHYLNNKDYLPNKYYEFGVRELGKIL